MVAVLVLGACGDDDGDTAALTPSPVVEPTPEPDEGAEELPTATPGPAGDATPTPGGGDTNDHGGATPTPADGAATPGPSGECTAALPEDRRQESLATADVDGDGRADTVLVYAAGPVEDPSSWRLRVELAGGGALETSIDPTGGVVSPPRAMGGFDVAGDGRDEIWATVGSGAATQLVALWTVDGCDLVQVSFDGAEVVFPIGATVGTLSGLECRDIDADGVNDALVAWNGMSDDGTNYELQGQVFTLEGSELRLRQTDGLTVDITSADGGRYADLDCGSLTLP